MKRLKEVIEHDKENVSLVQRQSRTENFLGRINSHRSISSSTVSQSLVMYVAGILWGIWTIIKDQAYD